jgi:hypothetical protein
LYVPQSGLGTAAARFDLVGRSRAGVWERVRLIGGGRLVVLASSSRRAGRKARGLPVAGALLAATACVPPNMNMPGPSQGFPAPERRAVSDMTRLFPSYRWGAACDIAGGGIPFVCSVAFEIPNRPVDVAGIRRLAAFADAAQRRGAALAAGS